MPTTAWRRCPGTPGSRRCLRPRPGPRPPGARSALRRWESRSGSGLRRGISARWRRAPARRRCPAGPGCRRRSPGGRPARRHHRGSRQRSSSYPPARPAPAGTGPAGTSHGVSQRAGGPGRRSRDSRSATGVLFFRTPFRDIESPADVEAIAFWHVKWLPAMLSCLGELMSGRWPGGDGRSPYRWPLHRAERGAGAAAGRHRRGRTARRAITQRNVQGAGDLQEQHPGPGPDTGRVRLSA